MPGWSCSQVVDDLAHRRAGDLDTVGSAGDTLHLGGYPYVGHSGLLLVGGSRGEKQQGRILTHPC